jgi:hypothetical protein
MSDDLERDLKAVQARIAGKVEAQRQDEKAMWHRDRLRDRERLLAGTWVASCVRRNAGDACAFCLRGVLDLTGRECRYVYPPTSEPI